MDEKMKECASLTNSHYTAKLLPPGAQNIVGEHAYATIRFTAAYKSRMAYFIDLKSIRESQRNARERDEMKTAGRAQEMKHVVIGP